MAGPIVDIEIQPILCINANSPPLIGPLYATRRSKAIGSKEPTPTPTNDQPIFFARQEVGNHLKHASALSILNAYSGSPYPNALTQAFIFYFVLL